jgi:hypothetical protein
MAILTPSQEIFISGKTLLFSLKIGKQSVAANMQLALAYVKFQSNTVV